MTPLVRDNFQIREDMMEWIKTNIYARIGQEWDYQGKDFDPLVNLLVGACASELQQIYEAIQDSDRRVLRMMTEILLPEARHLPAPAYALAEATPTGSLYHLSEALQLKCDFSGEKVYFSPVFEHNLLQANLKVVAYDAGCFLYLDKNNTPTTANAQPPQLVNQLLLGFECPKLPDSLAEVAFFFDLKGVERKATFLDALAKGRWSVQKQEIAKTAGWPDAAQPEDALDTTRSLLHRIEHVFSRNFVTITDERKPLPTEAPVVDVLRDWAQLNGLTHVLREERLASMANAGANLLWVEIQLAYPVWVSDLEHSFRCSTKVFPVVNRQLNIKDDADTFFDRPSLNVIHINAENPFAGVRRVFNQQSGEGFAFRPVAQFRETQGPTFTVRYGGVGRMDQYNVWQRFVYILDTLREEHELNDVTARIGDKISIEDLHLMLGERISKDHYRMAQKGARDLYIMLHPGVTAKGVRAIAEYWTTLGDKANGIPEGQGLANEIGAPGLKVEDKTGTTARLITATTGGKHFASEPELFQGIKDQMLRRDRLFTFDDVKGFCQVELGDTLAAVAVRPDVELDQRPGFGLTRINRVVLTVKNPEDLNWENTCRELEMALAQKAISSVPFRVEVEKTLTNT